MIATNPYADTARRVIYRDEDPARREAIRDRIYGWALRQEQAHPEARTVRSFVWNGRTEAALEIGSGPPIALSYRPPVGELFRVEGRAEVE